MPAKRTIRYYTKIKKGSDKTERMFKHIVKSFTDRGVPLDVAVKRAAIVVNKYRRKHGLLVAQKGRRRWYPGKRRAAKRSRHRR